MRSFKLIYNSCLTHPLGQLFAWYGLCRKGRLFAHRIYFPLFLTLRRMLGLNLQRDGLQGYGTPDLCVWFGALVRFSFLSMGFSKIAHLPWFMLGLNFSTESLLENVTPDLYVVKMSPERALVGSSSQRAFQLVKPALMVRLIMEKSFF